jgi:F-type H+-transporting ATPase subunit c
MKLVMSAVLATAMILLAQGAASAQQAGATPGFQATTAADAARVAYASSPKSGFPDTRAIGVGLIIIGAGLGIGGLARSAVESMARQPETAGNIQTAMIIAAALIEGVTFFALIIVMLFVSPY